MRVRADVRARPAALLGGLLAALTTGLLLPAAPAAAATAAVTCGAVLTADARLTRDLHCPGGTGLRVREPGVVLDLGGHRLSGDRGIAVSVTEPYVQVRNGTLEGWDTGVFAGLESSETDFGGAGGSWEEDEPVLLHLDRLTVSGARMGLAVVDGSRVTASRSTLGGNGTGARTDHGGELRLTGSTVRDNRLGLQGLEGSPLRVTSSTVRDNDTGLACSQGHIVLDRSLVTRNGTGFHSFTCSGSWIGRSVFLSNDLHVWTDGIPEEMPTAGCTAFLGGDPPFLPTGTCTPPPAW
ncbi:hypothetical protein NUM3379_05440 [Kineococcus sp. NUM-3379]